MKHNFKLLIPYLPWFVLLAAVDGFFAFLLWLADIKAFFALLAVILLAEIFLFASVCSVLLYREKNRRAALFSFLQEPDGYHEEKLLKAAGIAQADMVRLLASVLRRQQEACQKVQTQLAEYEKYTETWAHEIKTPLSLLTFLLDNRREELPQEVVFKLDYIRNRMQGFIEQMLFYARLKGVQKDYLFERIQIWECIEEVLEDYRPLLEEKQIRIYIQIPKEHLLYTDRRGMQFLLSQLVSNAVKYSQSDPGLWFTLTRENGRDVLTVRDNGIGIKSCDLPYIFMEGFTGDTGENRKKATGMGLYLAKEMADDLGLGLFVESDWGKQTAVKLSFPVIDEKQ